MNNVVVVRKTLPASPEEVFDAWTDSEGMRTWMCGGPTTSADVTLDVRVGGKFRIVMKSGTAEYLHTGEFRILDRPFKLQFTWVSAGTDQQETLVTIDLRPHGDLCELTLTHERFPREESVKPHEKGWSEIIDKLGKTLEARRPTKDFQLSYEYPAPPEKLYAQFATQEGIRHWWTIYCEMEERVGGRASFRFPSSDFFADVSITRLDPPKLVEWEVTASKHPASSGFLDLNDWVGTHIRFEVEPAAKGGSRLSMTHAGLALKECLGVCSSAWAFFLNQSLRGYVETGLGQPHTK